VGGGIASALAYGKPTGAQGHLEAVTVQWPESICRGQSVDDHQLMAAA